MLKKTVVRFGAAALLVASCAGAAQAATIGVGGDVSGAGGDATQSQVAVNAGGDAAFVWTQDNAIKARLRTGNALGSIKTVAAATAEDPTVAIEPDGDAVFAWKRWVNTYWVIEARTLSAAGTLGATQTMSTNALFSTNAPAVAVDSAGNAVVAWHEWLGSYDRVYARTLSAAGTRGSVLSVSAANFDSGWPKVAYDAAGTATIAYSESDGTYYVAKARRMTAGVLGAVSALSVGSYSANNLDLAVEDDGDAIVAWDKLVGTDNVVQSRPLTAAGGLGAVQTVSNFGVDSYYPELGIDEDGDAVYAWLFTDNGNYQVQARTRTAAGTLGGVLTLSQPGRPAGAPDVAVAANGTAAFAWNRTDSLGDGTIKYRKLYSTGVLSDVAALTDTGDAENPHVGISDGASAVFAWENDGDVEYFANSGGILNPGGISTAPPSWP